MKEKGRTERTRHRTESPCEPIGSAEASNPGDGQVSGRPCNDLSPVVLIFKSAKGGLLYSEGWKSITPWYKRSKGATTRNFHKTRSKSFSLHSSENRFLFLLYGLGAFSTSTAWFTQFLVRQMSVEGPQGRGDNANKTNVTATLTGLINDKWRGGGS